MGLKMNWIVQKQYLYALVLLRREFVGADGSHGDVGSDQVLVLVEEREGVHPTEGRADHHHREQAQVLAHLLQETRRGQFADGCRRLSGPRLTQSCGRLIHIGTCERMQVRKEPINMKTTGFLLVPGCKNVTQADKNSRVIPFLSASPGRSMATARHPALARVSRVPMLSQFSEEKRMP